MGVFVEGFGRAPAKEKGPGFPFQSFAKCRQKVFQVNPSRTLQFNPEF
jgi:hypothetical protein